MTQANGVFRKFRADEDAMVNHMIYSQNGTVPTAIRELVMNSIDKDADKIEVEISQTRFRVSDTGIGFASEEDIEKHFLTFGTPHQEGDATFGRFRIGRGQIMSLAKAQWHSHEFRMLTDVRNKGNGMELYIEPETAFKGCEVSGEFYQPISAQEELTIRQEITELVRYLEVPVYLNGNLINDLSGIEWDYEDEDVKILWEPAGCHRIKLYSIGVYVKDLPMYRYGLSAHVVTKRPFDLNMARNEISAHDPLWQKIDTLVRQHGQKKSREKASRGKLDDNGRMALIRNVISGDSDLVDLMDMTVLKDVRGHSVKLVQLRYASTFGKPVAIACSKDHKKGERLATRGAALVLHEDNLRFWSCATDKEFFEVLANMAMGSRDPSLESVVQNIKVSTIAELSEGMGEDSEELELSDLSPKLKAALSAAQVGCNSVPQYLKGLLGEQVRGRGLYAGKSDLSEAWTNGIDKIWINVDLLKQIHSDRHGADYVAGVLMHEYLHAFESSKGHEHDFDFYELFHELVLFDRAGLVGKLGDQIRRRYIAKMAQAMEKLPTWASDRYETERLTEVKLSRTGSRISKAAEIVLKGAGFKVDMKPSKALIFADKARIDGAGSKIVTKFWQVLKKDGYLSVTKRAALDMVERSRLDEYYRMRESQAPMEQWGIAASEVHRKELAHIMRQFDEALVKWLEANEQDMVFARAVRQIDGLSDVLSLLCRDENSDFGAFTYEVMEPRTVYGAGRYAVAQSAVPRASDEVLGWIEQKNPEVLDNRKDGRKAMVTKRVLEALSMIADDTERDSMAKAMLSEGLYLEYRADQEARYSSTRY